MEKANKRTITLVVCIAVLSVVVYLLTNYWNTPVTTSMVGAAAASHDEIVGTWVITGIGEDINNMEPSEDASFSITFNDDGTADTSFIGTAMWKTEGNTIKLYKNLSLRGTAVIKDGVMMYHNSLGDDECIIMNKTSGI